MLSESVLEDFAGDRDAKARLPESGYLGTPTATDLATLTFLSSDKLERADARASA